MRVRWPLAGSSNDGRRIRSQKGALCEALSWVMRGRKQITGSAFRRSEYFFSLRVIQYTCVASSPPAPTCEAARGALLCNRSSIQRTNTEQLLGNGVPVRASTCRGFGSNTVRLRLRACKRVDWPARENREGNKKRQGVCDLSRRQGAFPATCSFWLALWRLSAVRLVSESAESVCSCR